MKSECLKPLIILVALLVCLPLMAQQKKAVQFYQIIEGDSVKFFINERNFYVESHCADFFRYAKVDKDGYFDGFFKDMSNEGILLAAGRYEHGAKQGYFEMFYPNGVIRSRGNYKDHLPLGKWEFFYDNGSPERTLQVTEQDTIMISFVDPNGKVLVQNGAGQFNGFVAATYKNTSSASVEATGEVLNGKPNGKWTSQAGKIAYAREEFVNGEMIKGEFPKAKTGVKKYTFPSFLNTFFLGNSLTILEELRVEKCHDTSGTSHGTVSKLDNTTSFNYSGLMTELGRNIEYSIQKDFKDNNTSAYVPGYNYFSVEFLVDQKGQPNSFSMMSSWGHQFFHSVRSSIERRDNFPAYGKKMYFHVRVNFLGDPRIT